MSRAARAALPTPEQLTPGDETVDQLPREPAEADNDQPKCCGEHQATPASRHLVTAPCPAQAPPRTRLLPGLVTDGFGQGRLRVYMPMQL
jgi:hypothetical protein